MKREAEKKNARDPICTSRTTLHASRLLSFASRFTLHASRCSPGFTLIEVIGVLAVMATLMAIVAPTVLDQIDRAAQAAEDRNLRVIAQGVEMYVREVHAWPANLAALSPHYVPFGNTQLAMNDRGYPRYFVVHPDTSAFSNAAGLAASSLPDMRFLLISNIRSDANPTITTAGEFDSWWNTDETATPELKIHRGHLGQVFHLLSISAVGSGGSYRIDGTATNAGSGGTLASRGTYHVVGTVVEFDENFNFSPGNVAFGFTLASDAGYQFDPGCSSGSQWHVLGMGCS